jgi:hypothetical protein
MNDKYSIIKSQLTGPYANLQAQLEQAKRASVPTREEQQPPMVAELVAPLKPTIQELDADVARCLAETRRMVESGRRIWVTPSK